MPFLTSLFCCIAAQCLFQILGFDYCSSKKKKSVRQYTQSLGGHWYSRGIKIGPINILLLKKNYTCDDCRNRGNKKLEGEWKIPIHRINGKVYQLFIITYHPSGMFNIGIWVTKWASDSNLPSKFPGICGLCSLFLKI